MNSRKVTSVLPIDSCNKSAQKRQVQIFANIQIICFRLIWLKVLNTELVKYMELSAVSINFCTFYKLDSFDFFQVSQWVSWRQINQAAPKNSFWKSLPRWWDLKKNINSTQNRLWFWLSRPSVPTSAMHIVPLYDYIYICKLHTTTTLRERT